MILVTGGTGFIGRAVVRHLVAAGYSVRILIRPSPRSPSLPVGVPVEVAVASLADLRGLRAALRGVDMIFHLAGGEGQGGRANLLMTDIQGTQNLAQVANDAGIQRIIYVSHLSADRASAFPVLKAKGIAEEHIRRSGVPYTIFRSSVVFGPGDNFTTDLVKLLRMSPLIIPLPNRGRTLIQPLWIEDLVTCLLWSLENPAYVNQTYEIGGSEYFTLRQVVEILLSVIHQRRFIVPISMPYLRALTVLMEHIAPNFPTSTFWVDYLAVNRTCDVNTLPRVFGLMPARFTYRLDYLIKPAWYTRLWLGMRQSMQEITEKLQRALQHLRSSRG
jgi:NADH dehydrogenase